ncbi:hypothetical protein CK203_009593 [Vitis vinifera]|uniref:Uncharacterized protein n=1 Tax=Vitis vinifera TaxID=29760 RepID=A0A438JRZ1_VITVI|nr:hypothetical protein CK203_009593 [Vitis vinifera]
MEVLSSLLERTRRVVTRWEFGEGNGGECVEVSHQNIGFLVKILKIIWFTYVGCLEGKLPSSYLGPPLGALSNQYRGETHVDLKHIIQHGYLRHVFICHSQKGKVKTIEATKRFPQLRWHFGEKASSSLKKEWYLLNGEVAFEVDNGRKVADI